MKSQYDVVVVGAGAAGCVVAGKLASKTNLSILLLEAGKNDTDMFIHMPAGFGKLLAEDKHVWPHNTIVQPQLDNREKRYRSGRVIGGGSSVNAMCYVRGQKRDYDGWQQAVNGDLSWSFEALMEDFKEQEGNQSFHNKYHNAFGPLKVSLPNSINELNNASLRAFQEQGLPYNPDYNGEKQAGVSPVQANFYKAKRCSAAVAYLNPVRSKPNLDIETECEVSKVLIEDGKACGVEFYQKGTKHSVRSKDVILSSGAVHTPKLLMLSGVGDQDELAKHGIEVKLHSPEVGLNLCDHPIVPVKSYCKGNLGYQNVAQGLGMIKTGLRYFLTQDGPAAGNCVETVSYFDPENIENEPTIQCYHVPIISEDGLSPSGTTSGITFELVVLQPKSRGYVKLKDGSYKSDPLIHPNFMGEKEDLDKAVESVKYMRQVMAQPSLKELLTEEIAPGVQAQSDEEIAKWVKSCATTMWHPIGTCRMGSDDNAVVDERLRVKGVENLRVIDASIMPNITSGNTNAPTQALANRGVNMFIADLGL